MSDVQVKRRGRPRNELVHRVAEMARRKPRAVANDQHATRARIALGPGATGLPNKVLIEIGAFMLEQGWDDDWSEAAARAMLNHQDPRTALPPEGLEWLSHPDCVAKLTLSIASELQAAGYSADAIAQRIRNARLSVSGVTPRGVAEEKAVSRAVATIEREALLCNMPLDEFVELVLAQLGHPAD